MNDRDVPMTSKGPAVPADGGLPRVRGAIRAPTKFFSVRERVAIAWESYQPRAEVTEIARRHGIAANTIYVWRRVYGAPRIEPSVKNAAGRNAALVALMTQVRLLEALIERHAIEADRLRDRLAALELRPRGS